MNDVREVSANEAMEIQGGTWLEWLLDHMVGGATGGAVGYNSHDGFTYEGGGHSVPKKKKNDP
ncbi:MAG: hypothetical protein FJ297_09385 [Planctomycetes bacterium]|nr:hypothetical protein [Planctomycetota bacterium]